MARTIYRFGKPYKYVDDSGRATLIRDKKDPIIERAKAGVRTTTPNLIRDTIKVEGKVIVGYTDKNTGRFIPSDTEDNKSLFQTYSNKVGSTQTSAIKQYAETIKPKPSQTKVQEVKIQDIISKRSKSQEEKIKDLNRSIAYYQQYQSKAPVIPQPTISETEKQRIKEIKRPFIKSVEQVEREGIQAGQSGNRAKEFILRGSADFVSGIKGTIELLTTMSNAMFKMGGEQKKGVEELKQIFSLSTLSQMGASIGKDIQSNNAYEKTRGIISIIPVIGLPVKLSELKTINSITKYDVTVNPISNSAKTIIDTKGILESGEVFTVKGKLRYDPNSRSLIGQIEQKYNDKTTKTNIKYKDKGGYFEDNKGNIISKSQLPLDQVRVNIKETTIKNKGQDQIRNYQGQAIVVGERRGGVRKTIISRDLGKTQQVVTKGKEFDLSLARDLKESGLDVREIASLNKALVNPKITKITKDKLKKLSDKNKLDNALKILKQRYSQNELRKLYKNFKEIKGLKPEIKAKLRATGEVVEYKAIKMRANLLEVGVLEDLLRFDKLKKKVKIDIPNSLTIPKLRIRIKRVRKLKGLPVKFKSEIITKLTKQLKDKLKDKQKPKKQQQRKYKQVQPQKKIRDTTQKRGYKTPSRTKTTPEPIQIKDTPKTIKGNLIKPNTFKTPKIPKLRIDFNNKGLNNKILTFRGVYRERQNPNKPQSKLNPIVTKTMIVRDTKNRALKKVSEKVDNSLARSLKLTVTGIGKKKKDIKTPALKKFRLKKSKNTPVLTLVEKSKYIMDKKGEKVEAKITKRTSKTIKKDKKSSKKGLKQRK